MSKESKAIDLETPRRQSLMGIVVYIIRNFRIMFTLFISLLAVSIANMTIGFAVFAVLLPASILFTILAYFQHRNFTFHVKGDELIIHKGVFVKDKLEVNVDRIQSIQITENVVQRILGLVALKVDTAGSKGNELEIPALEREVADALKKLLYSKKESTKPETAEAVEEKVEMGKTLVRLNLIDLLKVGLTENHLKTGLIAFAFVFGTISQYQDIISEQFDESIDEYTVQLVDAGFQFLILFFLLYAIFSILLSVGRSILRFYGLKAVLREDTVDISTGLLKRNHFRIPVSKVQFIEWSNNPLRKAVGYESAKLKPSNSVGENPRQQNIEIPALRTEKSALLAEGVFGNYTAPQNETDINAMAYARLAAIVSGLIFLSSSAVVYQFFGWYASIPLGLWMAITVSGYFYGRSIKFSYSEEFILIEKGVLFKQRIVIPTYKIQSVSRLQNIFLKRRKLNHIKLYTAAGSKRVKYIPSRQSEKVYDHILKCVEQSEKPWM